MTHEVEVPATEQETAEIISVLGSVSQPAALIIRKLCFERDKYKAALLDISRHSVCCDARHTADAALKITDNNSPSTTHE